MMSKREWLMTGTPRLENAIAATAWPSSDVAVIFARIAENTEAASMVSEGKLSAMHVAIVQVADSSRFC